MQPLSFPDAKQQLIGYCVVAHVGRFLFKSTRRLLFKSACMCEGFCLKVRM